MTERISQYIVWVKEDSTLDMQAVDAFKSIPGYVEHEWVDWTDAP